VDPNQTFSFPVDIFAFGATLYQCITGREPFRGTRTVEMVHHVRKGALWSCEERDRLGRIGLMSESVAGSPYPSAWRQAAEGGLRRAGSLRVPASKPRLPRMPSAESLRASDDLVDGPNSNESPAGVKLWANWVKGSSQGRDPLSLLLAEGDGPVLLPRPTAPPSRQSSASISPTSQYGQEEERPRVTLEQYGDGSPAMVFLDGRERVPEEVRAVIKAMVDPLPGRRPTAEGLRRLWEEIGVGQE
jgi:serine/threonine protein kinase